MAIYIDIHENVSAVTARTIRQAQQRNVELQESHGVPYQQHLYDQATGKVYCLVGATTELLTALHREVHDLIPGDVVEIRQSPFLAWDPC
jgi:uncharacterized protein DUF4242